MASQAISPIAEASLGYLLYLYFWPFWMFKDVNQGNLLEQAAAYRYNREKRVYLPGYISKWLLIFSLMLGLVLGLELLADAGIMLQSASVLMAGLAGVGAGISLVVMTQIAVCYLFLCHWRH